MTNKYKQPGIVDDQFVNETGVDIAVNSLVKYGALAAVALVNISAGEAGSVQIAEVFLVAKLSTDVMERGDRVFLDHVNKRVQLAEGDDGASPPADFVYAGIVFAPAGNGVTAVPVKLNA